MTRGFVPHVVIGLAGFAAGLCVATTRPVAAEPIAPRVVNLEDPPLRSLDANLWMQSSAEYRACCHQAYNLARRRLIEKLADEPAGGWQNRPRSSSIWTKPFSTTGRFRPGWRRTN